ncbi:MAG: zinc-dependent metalloprotease [Planctomycetales bacterium]|nr:zinc-dependent metalloprotease [Planctomycetales bacterium]
MVNHAGILNRFLGRRHKQVLQLGVFVCSVVAGQSLVAEPTDAAADISVSAQQSASASSGSSSSSKKFKKFTEVTEDAKQYEGLLNLYEKDDHLYAAIKSSQLDKPFLAPIAIAKGVASAGSPLNFGDEWVIMFRRVGDKVQVVRKNIRYEAPKGTPLEKAVEQNYLDSVLMAIPIVSDDPPGGGVLVDFTDIFLGNFANLPFGSIDRSRSSWHKIKAFEKNVELEVKATFNGGYSSYYSYGYDDGVIDKRGVTVVVHYSLTELPPSGYKPRLADQRVGHFLNATKDFGSKDADTQFTRRINRWRLEKANPKADLSPPKKQIVWWVENTVPHEYRPYVEEGILEWNKAFEKIGYRNALGVRWQQEGDEFDAEDTNYCTFKWVTTPYTFARSGLRADPITGEMIDGDVIFDASWVRYWKQEYAFLMGMPVPAKGEGANADHPEGSLLDVGEIISPIMAAKHGYGMPVTAPAQQLQEQMLRQNQHGEQQDQGRTVGMVPSSWSPLQRMLSGRMSVGGLSTCQYALAKQQEFRLAAIALAAREKDEADGNDGKEGDKEKDLELPEEFVGQLIKEIVMHEVGHSLGLRHNFRASAMLSLDEVNDTSITRKKGMVGSVMDYSPINISPDRKKQGDYATTTIGPYDYWAIEYAYKPISGDEEKELQKIAERSPEPDLAYSTDEDLYMSNDPLVNVYDLGDDPLAYGKQRIELAENLIEDIDEKVVRDGESWVRLRSAFSVLLSQYGNAAYMASSYIGGQYFSKHHKSKEEVADPVVPVAGKRQREALEFLTEKVLSDDAFHFSPQTLRRLTRENWYHWGSNSFFFSGDLVYPVHDHVLAIQKIVLNHCFSASVLKRLQDQQLLVEGDDALEIAEVFRTLSDSIWTELGVEQDDLPEQLEISPIRRNLQREHMRKLSTIVIGQQRNSLFDLYAYVLFAGNSYQYPADARSLARMHLRELGDKLERVLGIEGLKIEDSSRAHLQEVKEQIDKVLSASLDASGP